MLNASCAQFAFSTSHSAFGIQHFMSLLDTLHRPLRNLRLSVTDRCNLRCEYCMPEEEYTWLPREDVLHFEEISALVDVFLALGVDRLRLTGGEPLLRRELLAALARRYGTIEPLVEHSAAPAQRFTLPDGTVFGIISSTTAPFCRTCDRSRLTADGMWYLCLYAASGTDLRAPLRRGASR